ncbi:secretin N-terminal domain-containing protein [Pseudomonas matsuisoli]|uniref:NolW-like domain-containing protein n=1 Tax=Pseudomonas matsuisoli TaxID=1515666 RepID=A0A917PMD1_9PSED|nr:secretin N-terminal domain-containing protein [Pseudomonas matsuisoli]GGJ84308.1 hypothetical protein GCM10009304_07860 [Pseudomonas matsuisoli]
MNVRPLTIALLSLTTCSASAATEVIPLNHRLAADVLPIVQSILGNQGKADAYGSQLIVNTTPAKLAEIRGVMNQLDQAPRQLLISVDTSDSATTRQDGYSINGQVGGRDIQLRSDGEGPDGVTIIRRSTESQDAGVQQVQATEGYPAMIQVGQSVPLSTNDIDRYGQTYQGTQYRDVTRGFYVTASLTGDTVHLVLSSNRDRVSAGSNQVIELQSADTRVSGKIGEWIPVGSVGGSYSQGQSGLLKRYETDGRNDMSLRVKVDLLN